MADSKDTHPAQFTPVGVHSDIGVCVARYVTAAFTCVRQRPLRDTKDTDDEMTRSHRPLPLHRVLPGRSLLILAVLVLVVAGLATAAFQM